MNEIIKEKLDNNECKVFIEKNNSKILIDDSEFIDNRTIDKLIIDIALKYEHNIKAGQQIILNNYNIRAIPDRQEIWDFLTNKDITLCPCCVYNYITIFTFHIRYRIDKIEKEQYTLENLLPLCHMCYTLLGDKSYKTFKEEYDRRYKALLK